MSRMTRWFWILAVVLALTSVSVFAEETKTETGIDATITPSVSPDAQGGSSPAAASGLTPMAVTPEGTASAPAAPAPVAPPALKPITITFSGEVASVAAAENPPMITIQDRYGVKKEISVPSDAKITAGSASKSLSDLKAGDKVTVEYTYDVATGKRTAQVITVGEATPAAGK